MAEVTQIAWTERTWNPWRGCTKVSPGCKRCYMFAAQERFGNNPREVVRTKTWADPPKWEKHAASTGRFEMVFTCSWSDWFHADADLWRPEAWAVVRRCPHLQFQILTKRSERIALHLPTDWGRGYSNVWLGVSVENDDYVHRVDDLRRIPAAVRFISAEPLLGPLPSLDLAGIDWLIVGGESGPGFRPMDLQWARSLKMKCQAEDIAFFFKQSAGIRPETGIELDGEIVRAFPLGRNLDSQTRQQRSLFV